MTTTRRTLLRFLAIPLAMAAVSAASAEEFTPTRFSVEVTGSGPDVVLIPGLGTSRAVWSRLADGLAATHRLHLVQVRGFAGEPAGDAEGPLLATLTSELGHYIAAENLDRPAVIGHSMGGLVGLMLARSEPDKVGRLMIVESLPFFSVIFAPSATAESIEPQARALHDQNLQMDDATFIAQQNAGVRTLVRNADYWQQITDWTVRSDRRILTQALYELMTTDMRASVAGLAVPVTVVYAYHPAMGDASAVDALYRAAYSEATGVTFARVDDAFHFVMLDQPEVFAGIVADFLR